MDRLSSSGYSAIDTLSVPGDSGVITPTVDHVPNFQSPGASPVWYLAAFVVVLVILHILGRQEKLGLDPQIMGVGVWNFIAVGFMASVWILTMKLGINKFAPASTAASVINVL